MEREREGTLLLRFDSMLFHSIPFFIEIKEIKRMECCCFSKKHLVYFFHL